VKSKVYVQPRFNLKRLNSLAKTHFSIINRNGNY